MTLDRVLNYISKRQKTLVYLHKGIVRCTDYKDKLARTVINNKCGEYMIAGVYTNKIEALVVEQDLLACGIKD